MKMNYSVFCRIRAVGTALIALTLILLVLSNGGVNKIYGQSSGSSPAAANEKTAPVDSQRLETIEELSESLANDILELSVATRDRDLETIAAYFPAILAAKQFPSRPVAMKNQVKWVNSHLWEVADKKRANTQGKITGKDFLADWEEFLAHFSEIEDARFKVKEANFDDNAKAVLGAEEPTAVVGAAGKARIAFYVIGRDINGKREWARGSFKRPSSVRREQTLAVRFD
jgi:hypothetical protein